MPEAIPVRTGERFEYPYKYPNSLLVPAIWPGKLAQATSHSEASDSCS